MPDDTSNPNSVRELRRAVRRAAIRQLAVEAEARGEGNAVTAYMLEHGRVPPPSVARKIAKETGMAVVGSDGLIYTESAFQQVAAGGEKNELWWPFKEAVEYLASAPEPAAVIETIPSFQRASIEANLRAALAWLQAFEAEWSKRKAET